MIQLQSIPLLNKEVCEISELYYHKKGDRTGYNGYFNLFYVGKRKKYTDIENLKTSIRLCGYKKLVLVHDGIGVKEVALESRRYKECLIDFPYNDYNRGCFRVTLYEGKSSPEKGISGYYATDPMNCTPRKVNIRADICTFRREEYVAGSPKQLKEKILNNFNLSVLDHIGIYTIDSGQTPQDCKTVQLMVRECSDKAAIVPNINTDGAGGFSRGMIEIPRKKDLEDFTRVLLIDDGAIVEPDLLARIYGFLSTIKQAWKDTMVGGVLLREDHPYLLLCARKW